jgi:4-hydroxyphenylpyruvate dioxygenase
VVIERVKASGLPVACVGVELGWMFTEGDDRTKLLNAFAESCRWAVELGSSVVMSPSDRGRGSLARAAESIREVGDIARASGVRLALEFNSQAEQFNSLPVIREVVAKAGHPSVGLLLDTYHLGRSGASPASLADVAPSEVAYVQYSDVPRTGLEPGKALDRLPPGQGSVPFREMFGAILAKGYTGYFSYEAPNPAAWSRPPADVAREALLATRAVL